MHFRRIARGLAVAITFACAACTLFADGALDGFTGGREDSGVEASVPPPDDVMDAGDARADATRPQGCAGESRDGSDFFACFDYDNPDAAPLTVVEQVARSRVFAAPDDSAPSPPNVLVVQFDGGGSGTQLIQVSPATATARHVSVDFWVKAIPPFAGQIISVGIGGELISVSMSGASQLFVAEQEKVPYDSGLVELPRWTAALRQWTHGILTVSLERQQLSLLVNGEWVYQDTPLRRSTPVAAPVILEVGVHSANPLNTAQSSMHLDNVVFRVTF
jgi:hypothetical protein